MVAPGSLAGRRRARPFLRKGDDLAFVTDIDSNRHAVPGPAFTALTGRTEAEATRPRQDKESILTMADAEAIVTPHTLLG